jgi:glyoxylase-like metal-dependent hydrolase (beta-lactamase superfamily II)
VLYQTFFTPLVFVWIKIFKRAIKFKMMIHRIVDRTFPGGVNIYLVEAEVPFLVDSGTGADTKRIIREIENITSVLDSIILTHGHYDHSSGAKEIAKHFKAPIYVHHQDSRLLNCEHRFIEEGEFFGFRVIHTPGHSPGSICLFDEKNQDLICGDLVFSEGGVGRWDLPYGDLEKLKSSVLKISRLKLKNLYPGHGLPSIGFAKDSIEKAISILRKASSENAQKKQKK